MLENKGRSRGAEIEDCFRIMKVEGRQTELFVPACVQFKIRNFTQVNFENLVAQVNGVLCVNFLIFTESKHLQTFLTDRLYFNPAEQRIIAGNRRKKMDRGPHNYIPIMFNKDDNIKIPTTRTKQFQIQSFKTNIKYTKNHANVQGIRIFHTLRKEFSVEIVKNGLGQNFLAPFDFIKLDLVITLDHMNVAQFQFDDDPRLKQAQKEYLQKGNLKDIKRLYFNILRIEDPFIKKNIKKQDRVLKMAPMIAYSSQEPFGKYDVVQTELQAYTHDERQFKDWLREDNIKRELFQDSQPTQLSFKPFKYAVFKIPLFRYPVVDMMTIFIPLWLLSFVSVYIYFQTTEIMNRIVNVAGLMIAYAAIQPIVRQNLPEATTITLVDILIYTELLINILFLIRSIDLRILTDDPATSPTDDANQNYSRWQDGLFLASFIIAILNVAIVLILIIIYMVNKRNYKAKPLPRSVFSISDRQNWSLTLMMERTFARYKEQLIFLK